MTEAQQVNLFLFWCINVCSHEHKINTALNRFFFLTELEQLQNMLTMLIEIFTSHLILILKIIQILTSLCSFFCCILKFHHNSLFLSHCIRSLHYVISRLKDLFCNSLRKSASFHHNWLCFWVSVNIIQHHHLMMMTIMIIISYVFTAKKIQYYINMLKNIVMLEAVMLFLLWSQSALDTNSQIQICKFQRHQNLSFHHVLSVKTHSHNLSRSLTKMTRQLRLWWTS